MLSIGQLERMSIDSTFLFSADELLLDASNDYLQSDKSNDVLDFDFVLPSVESCTVDSLSMARSDDSSLVQGNPEQSVRSGNFQDECLDSILALSYPDSSLDYKESPKMHSSFAVDNSQLSSFSFTHSSTNATATTPTPTPTSSLSTPTSFLITPIYEDTLVIDPTSICRPCDVLEFNDSFTEPLSPSISIEKPDLCNTSTTAKRYNVDYTEACTSSKKQRSYAKESECFPTELDVGNQFMFEDLFRDLDAVEAECDPMSKMANPCHIADMVNEFFDTESSEGTPDKEDMDSDYTPPSSRRSSISSFGTDDIGDPHLVRDSKLARGSRETPNRQATSSVGRHSRKRSVTERNESQEYDGSIAVYACDYPSCEKVFTRLYNLKSHYRTHTDDRPFACDKCDQTFSRNHDLKRHYKIHSGVKPFNCEHCGKKFSRMDALGRHRAKRPQCRE